MFSTDEVRLVIDLDKLLLICTFLVECLAASDALVALCFAVFRVVGVAFAAVMGRAPEVECWLGNIHYPLPCMV